MNDQLAALLKAHRTVSVGGALIRKKAPSSKRYSKARDPESRVVGHRRITCDESWIVP